MFPKVKAMGLACSIILNEEIYHDGITHVGINEININKSNNAVPIIHVQKVFTTFKCNIILQLQRSLPVRIKSRGVLISGLVKMKIAIKLLTIPNAMTIGRIMPKM